jgi:hypothetical protein
MKHSTILTGESLNSFGSGIQTLQIQGCRLILQLMLEEFWGQRGTKSYIDSSVLKLMELVKPSKRIDRFPLEFQTSNAHAGFSSQNGGTWVLLLWQWRKRTTCVSYLGAKFRSSSSPNDTTIWFLETYIYGTMNGEVIQDVQDGKLQYRDLTFR